MCFWRNSRRPLHQEGWCGGRISEKERFSSHKDVDHLSSPRNVQLRNSTSQYIWDLFCSSLRERERKEGQKEKKIFLVEILVEFLKLPQVIDIMMHDKRDI